MSIDLHYGNAPAFPDREHAGYTTLAAPAPPATCDCGAELQTEDERLDERCADCSTAARARWDAAAASRAR